MKVSVSFLFLAGCLFFLGCEDTQEEWCEQACERLYVGCEAGNSGPDGDAMLDTCEDECGVTMGIDGELGDYDPTDSNNAAVPQNRTQAEAWVDCIVEMSCEDLSAGSCAPVW